MNSNLPNQLTDTLMMIQPVQFAFNTEAFETNSFQHKPADKENQLIKDKALNEFQEFVAKLKATGINVIVFEDSLDFFTPDSIFPNNWISTHENGDLYTYPMAVSNRRQERKDTIINSLIEQYDYQHKTISHWENETPPRYLEGTGSMIFDRKNQICYAALSPRSGQKALTEFGEMSNFEIFSFEAFGKKGEAIYHTNVMLSIGESFACVGTETISKNDRSRLIDSLKSNGKEIIEFSNDQIYSHFAGNMLQVKNENEERVLIMSNRIYQELTSKQKALLQKHNDILLPINIQTIEKIGGGSVRCMLAEIFKK